ncbi:Predicted integral membrane protein [Parapedobacter composti]|uniref:Predicted integral membrane protein n=1 Tax=Parapedobacter composti TaxID=623281 RepID=A0A1I1KV49_9SPHI|nr:DUF2269 family protein [Parapedobacter composti]SFC64611.1 Predicted integral membrane protein [Parapedobacter composti]
MDKILILLHLFAVIVFLGNIITEIRWLHKASKTGNKETIRFAITEIIKGDKVFTLPCVFVITATGSFVYNQFPILENRWLLFALTAYIISGIVYTLRVAPLQKKIAQLVADNSATLSSDYKRAYTSWNFWGLIALLTAAMSLIFTTIKFPL